jgi:hypothetical protein
VRQIKESMGMTETLKSLELGLVNDRDSQKGLGNDRDLKKVQLMTETLRYR